MERKVLMVCSAVALLGLLLAATGFAAEGTRIKLSQVSYISPTACTYPRSPAMGLGLTAALCVVAAELLINVLTGCICCTRGPRPTGSKWRTAMICYVVAWLMSAIAFLLFLTGAALNDSRGEESVYFGYYNCYVLKPGVFAAATILGLASLALGLYYFLVMNSAKNEPTAWGNNNTSIPPQGNIAMGHPQFPPPQRQPQPQFPPPQPQPPRTGDPVFVHEDTYMRRQFT